jgi:hypothetical protein
MAQEEMTRIFRLKLMLDISLGRISQVQNLACGSSQIWPNEGYRNFLCLCESLRVCLGESNDRVTGDIWRFDARRDVS